MDIKWVPHLFAHQLAESLESSLDPHANHQNLDIDRLTITSPAKVGFI